VKLQAYLERVKFDGQPRANLDTLRRLHRGHVENVSYENLDVQLGRTVSRDPAAIFDKLVTRRRGGWCYEMNGLMSWALDEIGFKHTRMAGAVNRAAMGDLNIGNHLVLWVHLDRPYMVDVGFGDGLVEPAPFVEGPIANNIFRFTLEDSGGRWWRFHNDPRGGAPSFDVRMESADEALLDAKCQWLQSDPTSPFVQNAVLQRYFPDRFIALRGRVMRMTTPNETWRYEIGSAKEYAAVVNDVFDVNLPEAGDLWPQIEARHRVLFPNGLNG